MIGLLSGKQAEKGHRVSLIYSSIRDDVWAYRRRFDHFQAAFPWRVRRAVSPLDAIALLELVQLVRRLRPDILHLHCSKAGALGRIASRLLHLPAVYTPHGVSFARTDRTVRASLYKGIERLLAHGDVPVTACSMSEAAELRAVAPTIRVVPNAVDLAAIDRLRPSASCSGGRFMVGMIGLIKDQRLPGLVRRIAERAPSAWGWVWIGDGALRSSLEGLPNLEVTGWCSHEEALRRISAVDVVLHASRWEGMPYALLEVMALGKPVVVSDVMGTRDVVTDGADGLLVHDVYAVAPYADALQRLATDPGLRGRLGAAARERIARDHDVRVVSARWEEVYSMALASRGATPRAPAAMAGSAPIIPAAPFRMDH